MWKVVGIVLEMIFYVIKNMFEKDKEKHEEKRVLYEESKDAIKSVVSGDILPLKRVLTRLRNDQTR